MTQVKALILSNIHNSTIAFNGDVVHNQGVDYDELLALLLAYASHSRELYHLVNAEWDDEEAQVKELSRLLEEGRNLEGRVREIGGLPHP
ncbi:hypothetical protein KIH41_02540 [Litoribacter ruber]|uniref:Uncharacterized protein n=1 Tax=Litoribacter ruber TaxID=702568 RepID=A0AAP2G682_9BACT|nr:MULTISPECIES: hypothetical protein [Litoribacter]MBS9525786.1 hypothetical protein [Litoribacter alkaliphilus]MBT0810158.1 hypothetical protein [Litoribacter ruber]